MIMSDSESENSIGEQSPVHKTKPISSVKPIAKITNNKITTAKQSIAFKVKTAISKLNEKNGSSVRGIVKYIQGNFESNDRLTFFVKKYIKQGLLKNEIIQKKGIGLNGSFKLPISKVKDGVTKKSAKDKNKVKQNTRKINEEKEQGKVEIKKKQPVAKESKKKIIGEKKPTGSKTQSSSSAIMKAKEKSRKSLIKAQAVSKIKIGNPKKIGPLKPKPKIKKTKSDAVKEI